MCTEIVTYLLMSNEMESLSVTVRSRNCKIEIDGKKLCKTKFNDEGKTFLRIV
jgi:hypothetical protein